MAASQLANVTLWHGYTLGDSGWGDNIDFNLRVLDAVVQARVISRVVGTPPATPTEGDMYIVPAGASGAWATHADQLALWQTTPAGVSSWAIITAKQGWGVYVLDEAVPYTYSGSSWVASAVALVPFLHGTGLTSDEAGYRNIPQVSQSANYTMVAGDSGKHILHPSSDTTARTFTIPANSAVAYPIGTAITVVNQHGAGTVTIGITTDSLYLAGSGTTGSRTLAPNGIATLLKVTATEWLISGTGVS